MVKVAVCRAEMTPPAQQTSTRQQQMRKHFCPDIPFDAVLADLTGFNRQTGLFAEVTHLQRECGACVHIPFAISSCACVRVRVWCHATGRQAEAGD